MNAINIKGADSTLYNDQKEPIRAFALRNTLDTLYANDQSFCHYTTPFSVADTVNGYRDTLLSSYDQIQ